MLFIAHEFVFTAGEGEVVTALASRYVYKLLGPHTGGALSLVEKTLLDSGGPPFHVHENADETFRIEIRQWPSGPVAAPSEQGWREAFAKLDAALAGASAGAARIEA